MVVATKELFASRVEHGTTTTFRLMVLTQAAFRNRPRNRKPACRFPKTQSTNIVVSSALYDAEYGTQAGGQIDVVTKSGTNQLHGSLFGYLRNSVFDARNFNDFDINGNPAIPAFRYGQYGMRPRRSSR